MTRVLALFLLTLAKASTTQSVQELKAMMVKREVENARLRDQREQLNAELVERKQKDSIKLASLQEYKTLAESRSASRPQYQYANQYWLVIDGNRTVSLLWSPRSRGWGHDLRLKRAMKISWSSFLHKTVMQRVVLTSNRWKIVQCKFSHHLWHSFISTILYSAAEGRATALEKTLVGFQADRPDILRHIKLEAETRQKLSEVTAQLENYQRVYGDSSIPPDLSQFAKQFKQKDEELQQLRLIKDQQSQVWCSHSCRIR